MGRLIDFLALIIAIPSLYVMQIASSRILDPLRDAILESGTPGYTGAEAQFADMFAVVTQWAPLTGLISLILIVAYREFRRQKLSAARGGLR